MDYTVRQAIRADLPLLPDIERAAARLFPAEDIPPHLYEQATPIADFEKAHAAGLLWVAADEASNPVGFAHLVPMDQHIHLEELDVHPAHGRRGLGRKLVTATLDWARAQGYPAMTLTTFRHVPWNAPFYETLGFLPLDESDLSQSLREEIDWEVGQGLDREKRVAMRCAL